MSDSDLTDDDITDLIGDPPPFTPIDVPPDPNDVARADFLRRVAGWLERRVELEGLQREFTTPDALPEFLAELDAFVSNATPAHECWAFSSPQADWDRLAGRSGFALVANGDVTDVLVTLMS
ncbi:hypothetical protein Poly51_40370 [Rubripirellula tenax]|uniref:Uncharacterized protein n=1 Tax=Rubripirellula tenax TaxID=2528015 RepID=A0A5C6EQT7_9BACT|nr:hypothetical protein [Rubripirellula tenax]TWU50744.1 hypothetical protein Poly51_40370 [Rubripirellula tenax]